MVKNKKLIDVKKPFSIIIALLGFFGISILIQDGFIKGNVLGTIILIWIVFRISKSLKK
jgi:hypothetical protein